MTHTEIYVILGVGLFITWFGGLVIYKEVQHHFPILPGRNVLRRAHYDIELQDVNHIQSNLRDIDIDISSLPEYPTSQALVNQMPIRWDIYSLPRFSHLTENTPPGYSQITDNFINCPLELNSWNFTYLLIFLSVLIMFIIFKYIKTVVLIKSVISMSVLIPFSYFEIDFRDSFEWKFNSYRVKAIISYFKIQTLAKDIIELLNSLKDDSNYSMSFSFISSYNDWQDNKVKIHPTFIDNAIIINKESDPILITQFIMENLNKKGLFITNWLFKDDIINKIDPIILTVIVPIKVKI
jgi:hypothetical protein